jgi:hypothetical protein
VASMIVTITDLLACAQHESTISYAKYVPYANATDLLARASTLQQYKHKS